MATLIGAIVETKAQSSLRILGESHGIVWESLADEEEVPPYVWVSVTPRIRHLGLPIFVEGLSRELGTMVLAFAVQTAGSNSEVAEYVAGESQRHLAYEGEAGGWTRVEGAPRPWEATLFFRPGSSPALDDGSSWPDTLEDEISDEDVARFEAARVAGRPDQVLDLLHLESVWPFMRLFERYGLDFQNPEGSWQPPRRQRAWWWPWSR